MRFVFIVFLFFLFSLSSWSKDFKYEQSINNIEGKIIQKDFYGPPGYGEDPKNDKKIKVYILKTAEKNYFPKDPSDPTTSEENNIDEFQLFSNSDNVLFSKFLGKKAKLKGTFSHATSGSHFTAVIINVDMVEDAKK